MRGFGRTGWVLFACCLALGASAKDKPREPYAWPAAPDAALVQKALATPSDSGLVILERRCKLWLNALGAHNPGVIREEFLRVVIVNDEGVRRAQMEVTDDFRAKIDLLEARTVKPDGTAAPVDEKRDIQRVDLSGYKEREALRSIAVVNFPAPEKGLVLDLHFITYLPGFVLSYAQGLAYEETPALDSTFEVTLIGGWFDCNWAVLMLGDSQGAGKMESTGPGKLTVHVGLYVPPKKEPLTVPVFQRYLTLLCYMDLSLLRVKVPKAGEAFQTSFEVDTRGRIRGLVFTPGVHKDWWVKYLQEEAKTLQKFLEKPGVAADLDLGKATSLDLSLEERCALLYRLAQASLRYNPDAEAKSLGAMMNKGMADRWQGAALLSYLLLRAHIPHRVGIVLDRYHLRFSPLILNQYIFGFETVVIVEPPGKPPLFLSPGDLSLPYGSLYDAFQDSFALTPEGSEDLRVIYSGQDPPGVDSKHFHYDMSLDSTGVASGVITLEERGAPARDFYLWILKREFRKANPEDRSDKKTTVDRQEEARDLERNIQEEMGLPASKLVMEKFSVSKTPTGYGQPLELACSATATGLAQRSGDRWLLSMNPLTAGFTSPFTEEVRKTPIWYTSGGRVVLEGDLRLPPGATVVELPLPEEFAGPDGIRGRVTFEQGERDGVPFVHTRLEYDQPYVVGYDKYLSWKLYVADIARLSQSRCVITLPEARKEVD